MPETSCWTIEEWLSYKRNSDDVIAYHQNHPITREKMRNDVWHLMHLLRQVKVITLDKKDCPSCRWALCFDDSYWFTVTFLSVLALGDIPVLPGVTKETALSSLQDQFDSIVTDQNLQLACTIVSVKDANRQASIPYSKQQFEADFVIPLTAMVRFYTSGSTGKSKAITKNIRCLNAEISLLASHWGDQLQGSHVLATVSHQHQYGFTFRIMLPMALGVPFAAEIVHFHEQLNSGLFLSDDAPIALITSPAFLKRLDRGLPAQQFSFVLSAGGVLPFEVVDSVQRCFRTSPYEIYGSTETGVIAWRHFDQEYKKWQLFKEVTLKWSEVHARWLALSNLIPSPEGVILDDQLEFEDDLLHFRLLGRYDRIVKIEDKRVSLTEIESLLCAIDGIQEAVALPISVGRRQMVGAIIVLSNDMKDKSTSSSHNLSLCLNEASKKLVSKWSSALKNKLDAVAVPRRWRFVKSIEHNAQDKRDYVKLIELLNDVSD